jgi:intraflagellar transport protein 81
MLQVLKSRAGDLDDFLKKMEDKQGISGYTVVQSEMEKISALKQRIDESKGKTLQEISRIVDDINSVRRASRAHELNAGP